MSEGTPQNGFSLLPERFAPEDLSAIRELASELDNPSMEIVRAALGRFEEHILRRRNEGGEGTPPPTM